MSAKKLTLKQHRFVLEYLKDGNATASAIKAGYSKKTAGVIGGENLKKPYVKAEIDRVNKTLDDSTIAGLKERKQILSKIARGTVADFMTCGADGAIPDIGPENINSPALKSVKSRYITMGEGDGKKDAVVTEVEVRGPETAIDLLNKMDRVYTEDTPTGPLIILNMFPDPQPLPKHLQKKSP